MSNLGVGGNWREDTLYLCQQGNYPFNPLIKDTGSVDVSSLYN